MRGQATASAIEGRARPAVVGETNGRVQTESVMRTAAESVPAFAPPALYVRVQPERVAPGEVTTIHLDLVGQGTETIANVVLTNNLPDGLVYIAGSATGNVSYSAVDNSLTWEVGTYGRRRWCGRVSRWRCKVWRKGKRPRIWPEWRISPEEK